MRLVAGRDCWCREDWHRHGRLTELLVPGRDCWSQGKLETAGKAGRKREGWQDSWCPSGTAGCGEGRCPADSLKVWQRLAGLLVPGRDCWSWKGRRWHGRLVGLLVSRRDFADCWSQGRLSPAGGAGTAKQKAGGQCPAGTDVAGKAGAGMGGLQGSWWSAGAHWPSQSRVSGAWFIRDYELSYQRNQRSPWLAVRQILSAFAAACGSRVRP